MINAFIKGQVIETTESVIVAESLNYLKAQFIFITRDWNGLIKTAYFTQGNTTHCVDLDENNIAFPLHLSAGEWDISVVGRAYENGKLVERITTDTATIKVRPFKAGTETPFPEPTPTEIERIEGSIGNLLDLLTGDKTSLVNAINEVYRRGGAGGGGGTSDHSKLTNRDLGNQHPISAIKDLQYELDVCKKAEYIVYEKGDLEVDIPDKMSVQESIDLIFSTMGEMILFIPEKTSQLENDSGFVNAEYVTNAINGTLVEPLEIELEAGATLIFEFDDADNTFVKMYADTSAGINEGDTIADIEFMRNGDYISIKDMYTVDGIPYFYNLGKTFEGDSGIFVGSIGFSSGFNDIVQAFYDREELAIKVKYYSA